MTSVSKEGGGDCGTKASFAPHLLLHSITSFFGLTSSSSNSNSNSNANSNITINTGKRSSSSTAPPSFPSPSGIICAASLLSADAPLLSLSTLPLSFSQRMSKISSNGNHFSSDSPSPPPRLPQMKGVSSPGFPSSVRIDGVNPDSKGAGPAFVGQVFSMCDPSGTGLMAVTTRLDVPFISRRTPEWVKRLFATITKNEKNGPVFRFFMDLGDAVSYVKRLNIPTGMVGACRLDVAYEHFKEKPHMFQFVPSRKQVKAANKILKSTPQAYRKRRLQGVPVFTAQNLNIAIATTNGVKWYTPYFFDKSLLDSILEASTDQHFHTLIQNRQLQRRQDVLDDSLSAEVVEDSGENLFEPPEVQELLDEMGDPGIPLSVISKAAEIQILDVVDKVLLGNRWIRKATGIQPKFPYLVDSFEERSAASFVKAMESTSSAAHSEERTEESMGIEKFRFPFGGWFFNPWLKPHKHIKTIKSDARAASQNRDFINQVPSNPLLPKITMVGISTGEGGPMSRASLKKTMEDLTKELEQMSQKISPPDEDDPLFVANVGDYSGITRTSSS